MSSVTLSWFDLLNTYSNDALGNMCAAHRIAPYENNISQGARLQAIQALGKVIGTKEGVAHALHFIGAVETAVLNALVHFGGTASSEAIFNLLKTDGVAMQPNHLPPNLLNQPNSPVTLQPKPNYTDTPHFEDAVARATVFGLVFSRAANINAMEQMTLRPSQQLFIPEPVLQQLEQTPNFAKPAFTRAVIPAVILSNAAFDFQRDLSRYWRHARKQQEISFTTQGWMYKASFKTFLAALNLPTDASNDEPSSPRLWFMRRILSALGEFEGSALESFLSVPATSKLLALPMADRIKKTYEAWRHSGAWNELLRLPLETQGADHRREAPAALGAARDILLRLLSKLAAGHTEEWLSTDALIGAMRRNQYDFLFPRNKKRSYSFYSMYNSVTANPYGLAFTSVRDEAMGWTLVEQAFIIQVFTGPLFWMGLLELGYNANEQTGENAMPVAVRLTSVGAWLLGMADPPTFVESGGRVIVQPNFTVLALEPISDTVLIDLDQFADVQGGDKALVYQLSRESLYRGQQQGWDVARVIAFLETHQNAPLASNVKRTLEEWQTQHQRITLYRNAVVVQFADDEAREDAHKALQLLQPHDIGAAITVIQRGDATATKAALQQAGWTSLTTPAESHTETKTVRIDPEPDKHNHFWTTFTQPTPSVFTLGALNNFANQDEKGRWHISRSSVRKAIAQHLSVDQLLAIASELNIEPISDALEKALRKWGGFFGEATLQHIALLQLSSFEVLANLVNDEEIGKYFAPIEGATKPLAIITAPNVDELKNLLTERGITFA